MTGIFASADHFQGVAIVLGQNKPSDEEHTFSVAFSSKRSYETNVIFSIGKRFFAGSAGKFDNTQQAIAENDKRAQLILYLGTLIGDEECLAKKKNKLTKHLRKPCPFLSVQWGVYFKIHLRRKVSHQKSSYKSTL